MTGAQFVHLHVHSTYSPMRGVSSLEELCALAGQHGSPAMALTDTNGLYGAVRFVEHAKQQGLRPILGAELTTGDHRAVLLAKTPDGYANLCRIVSERHGNPSFDVLTSVSRYRNGLVIFTDDEAALTAWRQDSRQDLYVELTPGPAMHETLFFSRRIKLPPVATNRVYFSHPDDFATHRLLRAIALNTTVSRLPEEACCTPRQWLMQTSYAQVSFKSAYLRTHYPAEFMAAVISNQGGFYSTFAYVSEAHRMGLAILPPDVNESEWAYRGEGERLRMGLMQVKTIQKELREKIVNERIHHGPYRSFQDFLCRVKPDPAQARTLIRAGCCDSIAGELTRPALMWRLYMGSDVSAGPLPIPDDYSAAQKRAHEIESFGFLASRHPLTLYRPQIERLQPVPASQMHRFVGRRITMVGVLITEKSAETKHGQAMEFITLEDITALYDATLFPEVYRRCCHLLSPNRPYVVRGLVEESFGVATLTVHDLQLLEPTWDKNRDQLRQHEYVDAHEL